MRCTQAQKLPAYNEAGILVEASPSHNGHYLILLTTEKSLDTPKAAVRLFSTLN